ncbi:MAG: MogA/MoaB family molybdenum cofactor biosynthesis protein [Nitrososphaerota archaeon]|nr:MogA/MoaB family molybdenum cofactor biosynthesis protein [Aigarchaeota archaeon]MDW8076692.1 MogA/MoaB family molybdenum cofactor biosynthesis protein [Nitrososphaerota archaeon]
MSHELHRKKAPKKVNVAIVTVSTSRYEQKMRGENYADESGDILTNGMLAKGYEVVHRELIGDGIEQVRSVLLALLKRNDVDVIVFCGGTGITKSDLTIEAVEPYLEKRLDGFAELFRMISYQKVGSAAMLSRAMAGVVREKLVVCIPGSPDAAKTTIELLADELPHIVYMAKS